MREIKFRAWHKNNKSMCQNVTTDLIDRDYLEFMQYIGIKDKNGIEIYEGDIIQDLVGFGEVKWLQEELCYVVRETSPDHQYIYFSCNDGILKSSKIIGNIYENPELLETN